MRRESIHCLSVQVERQFIRLTHFPSRLTPAARLSREPLAAWIGPYHTELTMAAKDSKKSAAKDKPQEKLVADNRRARHEYEILDSLECGMVLTGSEVKSLRDGKISLEEAYARVTNGEVWLINADIAEYKQATLWNHPPRRPRKLLLHRAEVRKFADLAHEKGLTLAPLKVYFSNGRAKLLLGLCRGKQLHDKREALKKAETKREIDRAMRRGR